MGIKRYHAIKDTTLTNAFDVALKNRASGSNMGASDILEAFSIYGQETTSSTELSRILIKFPVTGANSINADRTDGKIPDSGSVSFYLRMFNARHSEQLPRELILNVLAVSQSWQEGFGLDMIDYTDETKDTIEGSNWINRNSSPTLDTWKKIGGDYHTASSNSEVMYTTNFNNGDEDLEVDVTQLVEEWILGNAGGATEIKNNYGFGVFLTSSQEGYHSSSTGQDSGSIPHNPDGSQKSFYTKRFFSRTSEFFFKRPIIEARWDSRILDDRSNFYYSSSLAPGSDNLNKIYLYNYVRGRLRNIPAVGRGPILVSVYSGSSDDTSPSGSKLKLSVGGDVAAAADLNITGGFVTTGVYSASFAFTGSSTLTTFYDVWHSGTTQYFTGSIAPKTLESPGWNQYSQYTSKITNLKSVYNSQETARFRVFARPRNFTPTMYTVSTTDVENTIIQSASYEVIRMVDNARVINNSTSSVDLHTYLSYDNSGSYFDLDMSMLEPGYMYAIQLLYFNSDGWRKQEELFKFRVESN